jgi:hypothetical protein
MSRSIAELLQDQGYFAAAGSLSDYEVLSAPPRRVEKIITLCILYGLPFASFVENSEIQPEELGRESIPDLSPGKTEAVPPMRGDALDSLERRLEELPLFLDSCRSASPSLRDCYWMADASEMRDPYLKNAVVILVNRRRRALPSKMSPLWQQPFHVLTMRDGTYRCAHCRQMNGVLVVHRQPEQFLLSRGDADVIGQVSMIVRKLR